VGDTVILKTKCIHKCNAGFNLENPTLHTTTIKAPAFICKECGRLWISAQLEYVSSNVWPSKHWRDYEHTADYILKEER
jgi:hypothetical protein